MNGESELMEFPYLSNWYVEDEEIQKFKDATYREFVKLCKNEDGIIEMNSLLNSEWMLRTYCASKMIMAATLLLNSAEYSMLKKFANNCTISSILCNVLRCKSFFVCLSI